MPKTCKYDANATPPQFTDHEGLTIESGSHVRVKIAGIRNEVGEIRAIGSINEDYLGYDSGYTCFACDYLLTMAPGLCKTKTRRSQRLEKVMWVRAQVKSSAARQQARADMGGIRHGPSPPAGELSDCGRLKRYSLQVARLKLNRIPEGLCAYRPGNARCGRYTRFHLRGGAPQLQKSWSPKDSDGEVSKR